MLDVFDFVEAEVEASEVGQSLEAADVGDEVVVEVEIFEGRGDGFETFDVLDQVLSQADAGDLLKALEAQGGDRLDSRMRADDLVGGGVFRVEEVWMRMG